MVACCLLAYTVGAQVKMSKKAKNIDTAALHQVVSAVLNEHPEARYGIAFKDLQTGQRFGINEHDSFHAASTMKTPVLIETFRQASVGKFSLNDPMLVKNSFSSIVDGSLYSLDSSEDSEKDLYGHIGGKLPISDILHRMITRSSNLSTNLIIDLVGAKNVMTTMHTLGINELKVLRGVEDDKAFDRGMNNITTAHDLVLVMEAIATGKAVNRKSSDAMISILKDQHYKEVIGGLLPPDVEVASKDGSITKVCHDSGIVFLPDGRKYTVALLSQGIEVYPEAQALLARVSKILYDYMINR